MMILELVLLGGVLGVASNPSPYYGALGFVLGAWAGCLLLMKGGMTFLCLVLFIVYLGGMMVVFAYTAALVGDPYSAGGWWGVLGYVVVHVVMLVVGLIVWLGEGGKWGEVKGCDGGYEGASVEWWGVSGLFESGGWVLVLGSWGLLVALIGVVEIVWGRYSGVLRAL